MQFIMKHIESSRPAAAAQEAGKSNACLRMVAPESLFNFSYGMFLLSSKDGARDNGCIINTAAQITVSPLKISVTVNKANLTHHMILKTGEFALSILTESTPFRVFEHFGFQSGKDADKFSGYDDVGRTSNGIRYLPEHSNSVIAGKITEFHDYCTHTLFIADVTEALILSDEPSATLRYYFDNIKPKPRRENGKKDEVL